MSPRIAMIAALNDRIRTTFAYGTVICSQGLMKLPDEVRGRILCEVCRFDDFNSDNDPHGERDFGAFDFEDVGKVIWKIDYYSTEKQCLSPDPADPKVTRRVLTIMLAEEY